LLQTYGISVPTSSAMIVFIFLYFFYFPYIVLYFLFVSSIGYLLCTQFPFQFSFLSCTTKLYYLMDVFLLRHRLFEFLLLHFYYILHVLCLVFTSAVPGVRLLTHHVTIYHKEFLLPSHLFSYFYVLSLLILIIHSCMVHIEDNVSNK